MPGTRTELAIVAAYLALVALIGAGMVGVVQGQHRARPTADGTPSSPHDTPPVARDHLLVAGTGVSLPLLEQLAAAQDPAPARPVRVAPSIGSTGAVAALRDGAIDCGVVSRALRGDERDGLRAVPFAHATVVLAAGRDLPAAEIEAEDLLSLVAGERRTWHDGGPVTVLLREPGDSSTRAFAARLPGFAEVHDRAQRDEVWRSAFTDLAMERALVDGRRSLGLFDRGIIAIRELPLQELPVRGLDGEGEVTRTLSLVVPADASAEVEALVAFVTGPRGQELVARWGYTPEAPPPPTTGDEGEEP